GIIGDEAAPDVGNSFGLKLVCPAAQDFGDVSFVIEVTSANAGVAAAIDNEVAVKNSIFDGASGVELRLEFEVGAEEGHACGGGEKLGVGSGDDGTSAENICGNGAIGVGNIDGYCGFQAGVFDDLFDERLESLIRLWC